MIKIISIDGQTPDRITYTLCSDTKDEVGATGAAVAEELGIEELPWGSVIYTTSLDIGILKSDDSWEWS